MNKKIIFTYVFVILMLFLVTMSSVGASEIDNTEDLGISDEIAIDNEDTINLNTNDEIITTDDTNEIINEDNAVFTNDSDDEDTAVDSGKDKDSVLTDSGSITVTNKTFSGIQAAYDNAESGTTITLSGTYSNDKGSAITINEKVITFIGTNGATLDAKSLSNIFYIRQPTHPGQVFANITFKNITFKNGNSDLGGAIYCDEYVTANIDNCTFINNSVTNSGGAVWAFSKSTITNSNFNNNRVVDAYVTGGGGAICGNCTVINCSFVNNTVSGDSSVFKYCGGAISNGGTIVNSTFRNNRAKYGGAIGCRELYDSVTNIVNCTFTSNNASENGGALYQVNSVYNSNFTQNSAKIGGAIFDGGIVNNSRFMQNNATFGGAIYGPCRVVNSNFTSNKASSNGGAIYISSGYINSSTFTSNSAKIGGAIYSVGPRVTNGCTFTSNSATNGGAISNSFLRINQTSMFVGGNCVLNAYLSDMKGPIANKKITFSINGTDYNANTNASGFATITLDNMNDVMEYPVSVSFAGDSSYTSASSSASLFVMDYSILNVEELSSQGNEGLLVANLYGSGQIANKTLIFNLNNTNYSVTTDSDGLAYFNIKDYCTDLTGYYVYIIFEGDNLHSPTQTSIWVDITKYDSFLTVNDLSVVLGDDGILTAHLFNVKGNLAGETLNFIVNGTENVRVTSSNGTATFNIKEYLKSLGEYVVIVRYNGNNLNNNLTKEVLVRINSYKGNLSVIQDSKYYNDTLLMFNLTNSKTNRPVSGATIKLEFSNGETINLITDSNGLANYSVPFGSGTYGLNASVIDSNVDVNVVELDNLTIYDRVGVIELNQNETSYNNAFLIVRLYNDETGDVYRNVKVNLDFITNGISDVVITNNEGIAVYQIPFDVGTYHVIASVIEDYADFRNVEKDDIEITKSDSIVIFNEDINFVLGGSGSTNFTVIGASINEGNVSIVDHPEATIRINGNVVTVSSLNLGNYILKVTTTPDKNHNSVTSYLNVNVFETLPTKIVFEHDIVFEYGSSGSTNFTVIGGTVALDNISVANHPEAVISLSDNIVTVSNLGIGSYNLTLITTPDSEHTSDIFYVGITVNKANSNITFTNEITFDYGASGSTNLIISGCVINESDISVIDSNGNLLSGAIIRFSNAKITVSNLSAGNYNLKVISTPDSNHNSVTKTCNITVNRVPSAITFTDISYEYGSSGSTSLILYGCTVDEENINVIDFNGVLYSDAIKLNKTNNRITISNLFIGSYTLIITTTPDENHSSVTKSADITVTEIASNVLFNNELTFKEGEVGILNLTVIGGTVDSSSFSIQGQEANFEVEKVGDDYLVYISNLPIGSHTLGVTTIPDSIHVSVSKYCIINVLNPNSTAVKTNTSISFGSSSIKFAYSGSGSVTVAVSGGTINVKNIQVVGHKEAVIKYSGGKITVSNLTVGKYTLKVTPTADANHIAKAQNITVTVTKIPAVITAKAITVYYKNTKKWSIKLINNSTKKAMASKAIVLKIYTGKKLTKTIKAKTNSKGIATFSIPKTLKLGTHKAVLSYSNSYATCKSVTSKIVVKKQALTINIGFQKFTDGSRTIDMIVKDKATKKALNKIKVKVMIYTGSKVTKTYTKLVTAYYKHNKENGFAMYGGGIKAFGSAGTHKIVVKPLDSKYAGKSNTIKLSVPKSAKKVKTVIVSKGKLSTLKR